MTDHVLSHVSARAADHPEAVALRDHTDDGWVEQTYADLVARLRHVCHGLIAAGLHPGDAVAIVSDNRSEWLVAELATLAASGVVVHVGPTTPVEELAVILRETEARAAFVSGEVLVEGLMRLEGRLPSLRVVISFDENPTVAPYLDDLGVLTLGTVVDELGGEVGTHGTFSWARLLAAPYDIATAAEARRRRDAWSADDIAFIDYTVGGAGELRGVVLTHRAAVAGMKALAERFTVEGPLHEVATLPLHHTLQHGSSLLALLSGGSVTLLPDLEEAGPVLRELRPNLLMTTMPVLRRLVQDALTQLAGSDPLGEDRVRWVRHVASTQAVRRASAQAATPLDRVRTAVARALLTGPLVTHLGGPKDVFVVAGSGIPPEMLHLLDIAGLPAHRGWSTLEAGPLVTVNAPGASRTGSVGRPLRDVEVRIDDGGEVLVRGPGLMRGYYGLPGETQRVLRDGWLHTGHVGRLDGDGYLHLTSRTDDMIVTDSLHYVAPHLVEARLRDDPLVEDAVVLGDGRPGLVAVIQPDLVLASRVRTSSGLEPLEDVRALVADPLVVRAVGDAVREANAVLGHDQRVLAFRLTADPLDQLAGPAASGYVRRERLSRECQDELDEMYAALAPDRPVR